MLKREMNIADYDAELWQAMEQEKVRQEEHIELIASENYTSPRVMQAQGSQLTNKYAEGYPGKRYYGGCEYVDVVEQLAIDRAKELFGADYANVQPHSGVQMRVCAVPRSNPTNWRAIDREPPFRLILSRQDDYRRIPKDCFSVRTRRWTGSPTTLK